jgi:predicted ATPase
MPAVHHLPPELSSFVGRAAELAAIGEALTAGRVLTLVGPGEFGKTRLAIRACQRQAAAGAWPDGVFWVGLEQEAGGSHVAHRMAAALDVLLPAWPDPVPALVSALQDRELLVVVDNCEHVLDGAARVIAAVLSCCPRVAVLATSRSTLGIAGERVWPVPPMDLSDALELFLERASASAPGAAAGADARSGARRVCDRLDRLPLALELAAGWAGTLSLGQIADSLSAPFAFLDGGVRTAPFRQRTLEGSMRWSHDLLDDDERVLFRRLGVFEPGFATDAVVGLAAPGSGGAGGGRLLKALRGLVDKSLVVADTTGAEASYRMLGVVRAYALARLEEAGESVAVRDRHLDIQLSLVERSAPLLATDMDAWRARVGAAYPNVRAAIGWGLSRDDPTRGRRLAAACAWLWHLEGRGAEGVRLLRLAAERGAGERSPLQAEVLAALALVANTAEASWEAFSVARAARELAAEVGAPAAGAGRLAGALAAIGRLAVGLQAALEEARAVWDDAVRAGDGFVADISAAFVGLVCVLADDYREAVGHLEPAAERLLRRGDRGMASLALGWLALAAARSGDLRRAGEVAERAVAAAEPLRDFHWTGSARCVLAEIRLLQGRLEEATAALAPIDRLVAGFDEPPFIVLHALSAVPYTREMPRVRAGVLDELALLAHAGDPERALRLHHEALRVRIDHDLVLGFVASLEWLALLHLRRGSVEVAGILAGAAQRARSDLGATPSSFLRAPGERREELRARLEEPALRAALERGRSMDLRAAGRALAGAA